MGKKQHPRSGGVITGDIVRSRTLSSKDRAQLYERSESLLSALQGKGFITDHFAFRGDSFQCFMDDPGAVLRAALIIKCLIKPIMITRAGIRTEGTQGPTTGVEVRLAIGIGGVDFRNPGAGASDGPAYQLSGEGLASLERSGRQLVLRCEDKEFENEMAPLLSLMDALLLKATPRQCQAIGNKLMGMKESEIAQKLGISQSAVNLRAQPSVYRALLQAVERFEERMIQRPANP